MSSTLTRWRARGRRAVTALALPTKTLHEASHVAVWYPWATEVRVRLDPDSGSAETVVELSEGTPQWVERLGSLAPTVAGLLVAVAFLAIVLTSGGELPAPVQDWPQLAAAAVAWGHYTAPSLADIAGGRA